jgi:hypothetical protein
MHLDLGNGVVVPVTPCPGMPRRHPDVPAPIPEAGVTNRKARQPGSLIRPLHLVRLAIPLA